MANPLYGMGNDPYGNPGLGDALGRYVFKKLREVLSGTDTTKAAPPKAAPPDTRAVSRAQTRPAPGPSADSADLPWWRHPSSYVHPTAARNIPVDYEHTVTTVAPEGERVTYKTTANPQPPPPQNPYSSLGMPRGNEGAASGEGGGAGAPSGRPLAASGIDYGNKVPGIGMTMPPMLPFSGLNPVLEPPTAQPQQPPATVSQPEYAGPRSSGPASGGGGGGGGLFSFLPMLASLFSLF